MNIKDFLRAMKAIETGHKLPGDVIVKALQEALEKAYRKQLDIQDVLVRVDVNEKTGEIKVYQQREIVEEVDDNEMQISLVDAKKIDQNFNLGDFVEEEVDITTFGRAEVMLAKNVMKQKIREAEKAITYEEFRDKVQEMVTGKIESVKEKFCLINIDNTIALMKKAQQMPNEEYHEGDLIRVVIIEVDKESKGSQVLVSRSDPTLVKRLFEKEVPEIFKGEIEIKAIAREAGERTKMAVYSSNENIDPIGACIGQKGQRVQVIIDELHGEKIDIFKWSDDVSELIKNALSPAEVLAVIDNPEKKGGLLVVVPDNQLSLAIGKRGKNARLAVKLTGSKIDIKSESDTNELGIDWMSIAQKQKEEYLAKKEEEKRLAQAAKFEEHKEEMVTIDDAGVEFNPTYEEEIEDIVEEEQTIEIIDEVEENEVVEEEPQIEIIDEGEDDLEIAARIAKEKHRHEGINLKEKQEYVSKFENLADASTTQEEKIKYTKKKIEEKEERRKPTFDLSKKDYEMKPIYSQEELEEIQRQEEEDEQNSWIHDEIDFDEYDEYYDE